MQRRVREGNNIIFDYRDLINKSKNRGKILIRMKRGPLTYTTEAGIRFFRDHPFQWVEKDEAEFLLSIPETMFVHFVPATIEDVEDYYL